MRQVLWSVVFPLVVCGVAAHGVLGYYLDTIEGHLERARRQIVTHVAGEALKAQARSVADAVQYQRDTWERMARWAARDPVLVLRLLTSEPDGDVQGEGDALAFRDIVERLREEVDESGAVVSVIVFGPHGEIRAVSPAEATARDWPGKGGTAAPFEVHPDGTVTIRIPIEDPGTGARLGWLELRCGSNSVQPAIRQAAGTLGDRGHAHLWIPAVGSALAQAPVGNDLTQEKRTLQARNDMKRLRSGRERRGEGITDSEDYLLGYALLDEEPRWSGAPWTVLLYRDTDEIVLSLSSLRVIQDSLEHWRLLLYGGLAVVAVTSLLLALVTRERPGNTTGRSGG